MDIKFQCHTMNTDNYKYYLGDNYKSSNEIRIIDIYKVGGKTSEQITYIRMPGGGFSVSREMSGQIQSNLGRLTEISQIEYEVILGGCMEAVDTFDRFFSYFPRETTINLKKYYQTEKICMDLGIPLVHVDYDKTPEPLLSEIPWVVEGKIMCTEDCLRWLKCLKESYSKDTSRNGIWMLAGINDLYEKVQSRILQSHPGKGE